MPPNRVEFPNFLSTGSGHTLFNRSYPLLYESVYQKCEGFLKNDKVASRLEVYLTDIGRPKQFQHLIKTKGKKAH